MVEVEEKAPRSDDRIFYDAFKANPNEKTGRRVPMSLAALSPELADCRGEP
jgi:hypothetical protein